MPGTPVLLIDGRSGSGKTRLAARIARLLDAQTLHLDDLYSGWGGLSEGSRAVAAALRLGRYRRYDWAVGDYTEERLVVPGVPLVIEGCGAITRENLAAARAWCGGARARGLWIACPEPVRRARALARDGEMFRPHWAAWAEQEQHHWERERPLALAAETVHTG